MLTVRQRRKAQAQDQILGFIATWGEYRIADWLDVDPITVRRWAEGKARAPKAALVALEAYAGRLPGMDVRHWEGWSFGADGCLYSPQGRPYAAGDIMVQQYERALIKELQKNVEELRAKLARATRGLPAANDGDLSVTL